MSHYNLVHTFIPMLQAMKVPDAKAAVDKEWKQFEMIPALQLDKVKSNKEVVLGAQKDEKKVHFATDVHLSSQKMRSWSHNSRSTKDESCSELTLRKTTLGPTLFLLNKARLRLK